MHTWQWDILIQILDLMPLASFAQKLQEENRMFVNGN
jgi:hypothetical protein